MKQTHQIKLIKELKENRTFVKMRHSVKDLENLTVVTDTLTRDSGSFMVVDCPEAFRDAFKSGEELKLHFEFTGKDKVKYSFSTVGGEIRKDAIRLKIPETIERHQRRRYFRIEPPSGTHLHYSVRQSPREFNVVNVSLGGVLGAPARMKSSDGLNPEFKLGEHLREIELVFPLDEESQSISIQTLVIVRYDEYPERNRIEYGLQFLDMDPQERNLLNEIIYRLQRNMLRRRVHLVR